ncbi:DNA polymerase Y family protein [Ferrimonas sp. SCSIO 43195]|uniref:Y-family DNA polymerase n=1 Tax=Ferrimonas sp. SCSIO 43195 TaxID=2822844 RepID=UPI002075BCE0|nr:DNA polymerase Y family protein [Ferrimonas sp. SCSIO 43195]USD39333.1 DNA polymerase Y family protein [Ferrimonas sp. SCSIO 43195]
MMLWLGLHFVDLALHYQLQSHPEPAAAALISGQPRRVRQCNDVAQTQGVSVDQSVATATALCPSLWLLEPLADSQEVLLELAQWAYGFSGRVVLVAPDLLLLEGSSMLRLFQGLDGWRQAINRGLEVLGLPYQQGLGLTPLAATVLARQGLDGNSDDPCRLAALLRSLPVTALQLPNDCGERLMQMGIQQAGQLLALPRAELGSRFGAELLLHLARLQGELPDPRPEYQPSPQFQQKRLLLEEAEQASMLLFPLQSMVAALAEFLRQRQLACGQFSLSLSHRQGPPTRVVLRPAFAESQRQALFKLLQLRFERLTLYQPVTELLLQSEQLSPVNLTSEGLSENGQPLVASQQPQRQLISQLSARLGAERVRGIATVDEIRPERAWRWAGLGEGSESVASRPRPPWLLLEPQAVTRQQLQLHQGPERLESGWWDGEPVCRDYYLAQTGDHRWCWAFRQHDGWFIHGWF